MSAWPTEAWLFVKCMTFKSAAEMWNKSAVKKTTITGWPILGLNPVSNDPCHTHSLYHAHRSQEHSAQLLLRCKWFVSTHHWPNAAPSPPLSSVCSFLTLSISAPPRAPLSPFPLFPMPPFLLSPQLSCSSCSAFFWLAFLSAPSAPWPSLTRPD